MEFFRQCRNAPTKRLRTDERRENVRVDRRHFTRWISEVADNYNDDYSTTRWSQWARPLVFAYPTIMVRHNEMGTVISCVSLKLNEELPSVVPSSSLSSPSVSTPVFSLKSRMSICGITMIFTATAAEKTSWNNTTVVSPGGTCDEHTQRYPPSRQPTSSSPSTVKD